MILFIIKLNYCFIPTNWWWSVIWFVISAYVDEIFPFWIWNFI